MSEGAPAPRRSRGRALALLLVLVFAASWSRPAQEERNDWTGPARALALVTPDVFAEIEPSAFLELNMARPALLGLGAGGWESHPDAVGRADAPPDFDAALPEDLAGIEAERPDLPARPTEVSLPPHAVPYVGLLPLLLALLALLAGNHPLAWVGRVAVALALGALWIAALHEQHVGPGTDGQTIALATPAFAFPAVQALLALAGACGLAWLDGLDERHDGASAPIVVGSLSVLLCGALMVLAARTGTSDAAQAVGALAERVTSAGGPAPNRPAILATAEHLTRVFEEAALVSFAAMSALLLHLKGRGRVSLVLLLAVALLDVARPHTGRWMDLFGALFG